MITDDFFVGIGDINSAFLPKLQPLTPAGSPGPSVVAPGTPSTAGSTPASTTVAPSEAPSSETTVTSESPGPPASADFSSDEQEEIRDQEILANTLALEAQVEERPLAKKQEQLLETSEGDKTTAPSDVASSPSAGAQEPKEKHIRKALLKNDDRELSRVQRVACLLSLLFTAVSRKLPDPGRGARPILRGL